MGGLGLVGVGELGGVGAEGRIDRGMGKSTDEAVKETGWDRATIDSQVRTLRRIPSVCGQKGRR